MKEAKYRANNLEITEGAVTGSTFLDISNAKKSIEGDEAPQTASVDCERRVPVSEGHTYVTDGGSGVFA